jgi:hypothetical protein
MKDDNRLWILIGKKLSGEATEDELKELTEWSQKDPDIPYYITILSVWWNRTERMGKAKADQSLVKLLRKMEKKDSDFSSGNPNSGLGGLKNFLKGFLRHLWKNKMFSFFDWRLNDSRSRFRHFPESF